MARRLQPTECYALINAMVEDLSGQTAQIRATDTSSFISAGELVMSYGTENVLNTLGMLIGRILVASRPYKGKWEIINAVNSREFTMRMEKISFYNRKAMPSGAFNTDVYTNISDGFTNGQNLDANDYPQSTKSQWEQKLAVPMVMNFGGSSVWQDCITIPEIQIQEALRNENEWNELISGILTEHENDIELEKEAFRNAIVLNYIAGIYDMGAAMPGSSVNLTEAFNVRYYGSDTTQYKTSAELRSTYFKEFISFAVTTIKKYSDMMEYKSANYHWTPAKTVGGNSLALLRHTPKSRQKMFMYKPLWIDAEAMVMPELFNDNYLSIDNYEGVMFWQNENDPSAISVYPAIPDTDSSHTSTYGTQIKGSKVDISYLCAVLFDADGCFSDFGIERATSTPVEARKFYRNIWNTYKKNGLNDFTEKAIIFYMADPVTSTKKSK